MSFPQTPVDTETIFAALFALGCSIGGTSTAPTTTPFKTMSRRFKQWSQTQSAEWPALYQFQVPQSLSGYDRGVGVRKLRAWWFVYLAPSQDDRDIVSQRMNAYTDALLGALGTKIRGQKQQLGLPGVVNVYPDGQLLIDEGLLEPPALIRIPICIIVGN